MFFINEWKQFGFRIALNNCLILWVKKFVGAKSIKLTFRTNKRRTK